MIYQLTYKPINFFIFIVYEVKFYLYMNNTGLVKLVDVKFGQIYKHIGSIGIEILYNLRYILLSGSGKKMHANYSIRNI
jgi:hypothetical protein